MSDSLPSQEKLASLKLNGLPISEQSLPVLVLSQDANVKYANALATQHLGYPPSEFLHRKILDLSPDLNSENWLESLRSGEGGIFLRAQDWSLLPVWAKLEEAKLSGETYFIVHWEVATSPSELPIAFPHDLDQPEKLARLSHFTLQRAGDAIFWIDEAGAITHVNEESCRRLGYNRRELTSMNIHDINPSFDQKRLDELFGKIRESGTVLLESHHHTKAGKPIPVEISTNYIHFEGKEYTCSIVRDITERKRKEAALQGALKEIRELQERLEAENNYLQEEIRLSHNFGEIITQNRGMQRVLREVEQVAHTQTTVLILGESGTGKELIARDLHQLSPRSDHPMIKVNCAALPSYLIESELFGHEKGAFTGAINRKPGRFELADKGTLFLDEVGEMPMELQAKLLRVLQEGEFERLGGNKTLKVNVRVIAATNRILEKEVENGNFREDLYYRLNVFPIKCPPLRDRKDDIPLLVSHFCKKMESRIGKKITHIPQKVLEQLEDYHFPGNIRELENIIERAIILSRDGKLRLTNWIPGKKRKREPEKVLTLEEMNRQHIIRVLKLTDWRVSGEAGAARMLGMKPTTLESRMKKLDIRRSNEAN